MGLSRRQAPVRNLAAFKLYAKRRGCRVSESLPEARPRRGAHSALSFHYDTAWHWGQTHSLAADINFGPAGTSPAEQAQLRHLSIVGESMGLGIIFARDGIVGAARNHRTHLHADCGSFSNTGKGSRRATPGDLVVWDTQPIIKAWQDNLDGADTKKRLEALRAASLYGGEKFPYGIAFTQDVVGTKKDRVWGRNSRLRHDVTMRELQKHWRAVGLYKGAIDMRWGPMMDQARAKFHANYGR